MTANENAEIAITAIERAITGGWDPDEEDEGAPDSYLAAHVAMRHFDRANATGRHEKRSLTINHGWRGEMGTRGEIARNVLRTCPEICGIMHDLVQRTENVMRGLETSTWSPNLGDTFECVEWQGFVGDFDRPENDVGRLLIALGSPEIVGGTENLAPFDDTEKIPWDGEVDLGASLARWEKEVFHPSVSLVEKRLAKMQ